MQKYLLLFFLLGWMLSACGQKGDLYLPDPNAKAYPEEQLKQSQREK